jgi:hypothetical protein
VVPSAPRSLLLAQLLPGLDEVAHHPIEPAVRLGLQPRHPIHSGVQAFEADIDPVQLLDNFGVPLLGDPLRTAGIGQS